MRLEAAFLKTYSVGQRVVRVVVAGICEKATAVPRISLQALVPRDSQSGEFAVVGWRFGATKVTLWRRLRRF
jgi:hypothetical protein